MVNFIERKNFVYFKLSDTKKYYGLRSTFDLCNVTDWHLDIVYYAIYMLHICIKYKKKTKPWKMVKFQVICINNIALPGTWCIPFRRGDFFFTNEEKTEKWTVSGSESITIFGRICRLIQFTRHWPLTCTCTCTIQRNFSFANKIRRWFSWSLRLSCHLISAKIPVNYSLFFTRALTFSSPKLHHRHRHHRHITKMGKRCTYKYIK